MVEPGSSFCKSSPDLIISLLFCEVKDSCSKLASYVKNGPLLKALTVLNVQVLRSRLYLVIQILLDLQTRSIRLLGYILCTASFLHSLDTLFNSAQLYV